MVTNRNYHNIWSYIFFYCVYDSFLRGLRTAIFSRLDGQTRLTPHVGYPFLANRVLRCHVVLNCENNTCYVEVEGRRVYVSKGDVVVFDDSKLHSAGNEGTQQRIVLLLDIDRPKHIKPGTATPGQYGDLEKIANWRQT